MSGGTCPTYSELLITKIEPQKRNKHRRSIFVDGEFCCGIAEDTLLNFGLRTNDVIDSKTLERIKEFDEFVYAKKLAYDYLSYQPRSVSEIEKKLRTKEISADTIQKTVEHLRELGLLNDEEFASQLISSKLSRKPVGKKVLLQKLYQKGVQKNISEDVIAKIVTPEREKEFAVQNFKKLFPRIKSEDKNTQRRKTFELLARRGFDFEIINEVIRENL